MIHKLSDIQSTHIGEDTNLWQYSIVLKNALIGKNCNINCHVFIENDVIIGDNVTIKPGVQVWDGLRIADNVFIGPNVTFTNDLLPRSKKYPEAFAMTFIETGASIGANATILAGLTIGRYAMIGAGTVLTKSVAPYTLWFGNPAKLRGYVTDGGDTLSLALLDKENNKYHLTPEGRPVLND
mgnify:CR=1 FL=1